MRRLAGNRSITRRGVLKGLVAGVAGLTAGGASYGYFIERYRVGVTHERVPVAGLPAALTGLRVGLLTDPHVTATTPSVIVAAAVQLLQAEQPDLIVLGGDFVSWQDVSQVDRAAELLRSLDAPHGVFGVLGNHDDEVRMPRALLQRRVQMLRDAHTTVDVRGEPVTLVGLRFWTRREAEVRKVLEAAPGFRILLAHDPRRFADARRLDVPLVLAGHTHGGQVVLPGLGPVAAAGYPVSQGLLVEGRTSLFVSRGVGTVYLPWRINCPPEVAVLTLEPA
jgi:hypothetical protein